MVLFKFKMDQSHQAVKTITSAKPKTKQTNKSSASEQETSQKLTRKLVEKLQQIKDDRMNRLPCLLTNRPNAIKKQGKRNNKMLVKALKRVSLMTPTKPKDLKKIDKSQTNSSIKNTRKNK